ncbi:MAG TPA: ATP-binding protein [Symbiobacteriaceae bacterium]
MVFFYRVLQDEIGQALVAFIDRATQAERVQLARVLWDQGVSLQAHLIDRVIHDENAFSRAAESNRVSPELLALAAADLRALGRLCHTDGELLSLLPPFTPAPDGIAARFAAAGDWAPLAAELAGYIRAHGAGDMSRFHAFRWEDGALLGIHEPDPVRLDDLVGNTEASEIVSRNTAQFLKGLPANNLLLYGDRGTGKSSTVKALVHRFGPDGLRLVEVNRADLEAIGLVMRALRGKAQKFIVFVDDLSFEDFEVSYKTFKAMLEGSLERRPANVLVYATSNRKHLIRERWRDRQAAADEVHPGDSLQELTSLADRFGVTVVFTSPDQEQYLAIVEGLAAQRGVPVPKADLHRMALQWVMWHNARSGRTARQFIDDLCGRLGIK